jgi:hypothetical protein
VGYRDKGDRSREGRDRRPPRANWSSAAEFGDATIDRPTPLNGRRDRAARGSERVARQSDSPTQRIRSDAAGWATITPAEDQLDDDSRDDRRFLDDDRDSRRYLDDDRDTPSLHDDIPPRVSRATSDRDEPRGRRGRYSDDEAPQASDSGSWRVYDDEPIRSYDAVSKRVYGSEPEPVYDEPRRSIRSIEEGPRRSRRALEESAQRTRDDEPRRLRSVNDDDEPAGRRRVDEDDPLGRPGLSDLDSPREWSVSEPPSRHYRDDSDTGPWRTRQTSEFETWRTENADAQRWRSETVSWRTRETIDVDTGDIGRFGTRAIGSSESGTGAHARHADSADLETWRSETGTWRTRDTATTGSWQMPPSTDDVSPADGDTGEWRTRTTPETGSWSRSRGRWVVGAEDTGEQAAFTVRRYDDTGEIPKNLLQADGRILDHDEFYESRPPGDNSGGRRGGRRAVDDERADDQAGERSEDWLRGRSAGRPEDERRDTAGWSRTGTRGARRALSSGFVDDGYRDVDEEPGRRSRYPRHDDDAPRYRAGRRSGSGPRTGRHASDGYDDVDEWRPTHAVARRASVYAGPRGVTDSVITPRASIGRSESVRVGRRPAVMPNDEDEDDEVAYGYAGAGLASVTWFGLPIGAFLLWAVFLGGTARADCVVAGGQPCPAPRDAAFTTFAAHLPQVGVAIVLSVVVALLIRLVSPFWRPATVGFAASVVGAGVTTVLFTVLNGG